MVGVIVGFPGSPRDLSLERAEEVLSAVGEGVEKVVVTPAELATEVCARLRPDYLQPHGCSPEWLQRVRGAIGVKLIGVVPVPRVATDAGEVVERALAMGEVADLLLLDTEGGGGVGLTHDWSISRRIVEVAPRRVFLAGGLNPRNVGEAIRVVRPQGVDVCSGVESKPGRKDPELMKAFIDAVRGVRD